MAPKLCFHDGYICFIEMENLLCFKIIVDHNLDLCGPPAIVFTVRPNPTRSIALKHV